MPRPARAPRLEPNERGIYEIRWTDNGRSRRQSTRTGDAVEAAAVFAAWRREEERERDLAQAASVEAVLDAYFREHVHTKVHAQGTAEIARKHLLAHFAGRHPAELRPADARAYARVRGAGDIGRPAQGPTIRRELGVLVAALRHAVKERRLQPADMPSLPLPQASQPRDRYLSIEEAERLIAAALEPGGDGRLTRAGRFALLAYYTAGRSQAVRDLEWPQVRWAENTINLEKQGRRRDRRKRRATVAMHPRLRAALERAFTEKESAWVCDHAGSIRKAFASLVARAGLPPDVTPHVLRHTAATHMLWRGVDLWAVAGVLGDTVETVQRVYGHHAPDALREAVEALL